MESEKKILGKKRKGDKILIEQLDKDSQDNEIIKPDNKIINEDSKIINKSTENLNLNPNNMKNNALSLNDIKNNSAFVNKIEQAIPLNFNNNIINNPKINPNFMLGKNMSFQNDTQSDQIIYPTPISNPQPNKTIPKKINPQISTYSDNSESSSQSQEDSPKNSGQKVKSHLQSSRNTAFGLKEISKRVMDIIKQSGTTTYKAISDQIVNEINEKSSKDEKNIRRRIYDSLNVMKSMKLFRRDKNSKNILWNYDQELDPLNENENKNDFNEKNKIDSGDIATLKKEIKEKRNKLDLLKMELIGLKNVLERNARENHK